MIKPARNASCQDCECNIGVKQPNGNENGEYLYCDAYLKIPERIASGKEICNKQIRID